MTTTAKPILPDAGLDAGELAAWRGLLRVHAAIVHALDAELEAAHGLPLSHYEVLMSLGEAPDGRMRMCDLAERVLLSRSGLTRLADRLERDGLICRARCSIDARGSFACLTDAGQDTLEQARQTHLEGVRRHFLEPLGQRELECLYAAWERVLPGAAR
ncbi:MAG: MarR family transcriptional regulator [Solirubrobacteraceae bacterium MAG38_C4-C5]|nr:MarR family transcriptional regulator [Candidatus Siliceabacter maunaloa]